jgi:enoyl-CoA hydratase
MNAEEDEVLFEVRGRAGLITLNRPKALNALTLGMVRAMRAQLAAWADDRAIERVVIEGAGDRAFCAGGDIRVLYDWGLAKDPSFIAFYREEYLLDAAIKRFPKPWVAVMDGITMGGGVGVSVHGSHRIATERLTFAMPETGIGLFPDVGGTYFLPRCPGETGMYLGLTGARLRAADALYTGIADVHVGSDRIAALRDALCAEADLDGAIGRFAQDPGPAPMAEHRDAIDRCFSAASVEAIVAALKAEGGEWAAGTARTIAAKSPTSLRITYRQLRKGAGLGFEDCMTLEFRMVHGILAGHDFFEGTRAVVIDKDQDPRWQPSVLAEVGEADVAHYFAPRAEELPLPAEGA